jgi:hypothetical protein
LDKHWIDDAFILHLYAESGTKGGKVKREKKGKKTKIEDIAPTDEEKDDEDSESNEYSTSQIRARLIGANCAPYQGEINVISADNLYKLFETVLGNVTMGVIEMCAAELNDGIGRDFTPIELMLSPSVRGMFARFVASKLEAGRESAPPQGHPQGGRYILAPSYKQKTAMSKWGIGLKLWFKNVYRQENAQYKQNIEDIKTLQESLNDLRNREVSEILRQMIQIIETHSRTLLPCLLVHHNKPAF